MIISSWGVYQYREPGRTSFSEVMMTGVSGAVNAVSEMIKKVKTESRGKKEYFRS